MLKIALKGVLCIVVLGLLFIFSALALSYLQLIKPYEGSEFDSAVWKQNSYNAQCVRGKMLRSFINMYSRASVYGKPYQNSITLLGEPNHTGSNQFGVCNFYHLGFCGYLYPMEFSMLRICYSQDTQQVIDLNYYTNTEVKLITEPDPRLKTFRQVEEELRQQKQ